MLAIYASSFLCAQTNADSNLLPNRSRMIALMEALSQYNSTMLVNTENTLEDEYVPSDLVYLTRIINPNAVTLKSRHIRASRDAAMAISDMANAMCAQGHGKLYIQSAYRPLSSQLYLYQRSISKQDESDSEYMGAVPPEASEHRTGLAFDIGIVGVGIIYDHESPEAQWLLANAYEFGLY